MDTANSSLSPNDFRFLNDLIHSGNAEIILDSDIEMTRENEADFANSIKIDVDNLVIDGNGHVIDAKNGIFDVSSKNVTIKNVTLNASVHNHENAILKLENVDGASVVNDGTLILTDSLSVVNNGTVHTLEGQLNCGGEIMPVRKPGRNNNFTYLKNLIDNAYVELSKKSNPQDNPVLIRFKGDIVLDLTSDECFRFTDGFVLDKGNIIIDGQGYSIDANHFSRIFTVLGSNIVIKNLILKNGRAENGGAIKNSGSLTLSSMSVDYCSASKNGGSIFNEGEITLERIFINNGGGIYNQNGKVTLDYVNFSNIFNGNAVYNSGETLILNSKFVGKCQIENDATLDLSNSDFDDGIILNQSGSTLNIRNKQSDSDEQIYVSTSLEIVNEGEIKAYGFDEDIPATTIIGNAEVEYFNSTF